MLVVVAISEVGNCRKRDVDTTELGSFERAREEDETRPEVCSSSKSESPSLDFDEVVSESSVGGIR